MRLLQSTIVPAESTDVMRSAAVSNILRYRSSASRTASISTRRLAGPVFHLDETRAVHQCPLAELRSTGASAGDLERRCAAQYQTRFVIFAPLYVFGWICGGV